MAYAYTLQSIASDTYSRIINWVEVKNLDFDEVENISLVFLLCDDPNVAMGIVSENKSNPSQNGIIKGIVKWAEIENVDHFEERFLEALCLIQNLQEVKKLSLYDPEVIKLKSEIDNGCPTRINAMRKALYQTCDSLYLGDLEKLIFLVQQDFKYAGSYFQAYEPKFIELNILYWICQGYISDGFRDRCDVSALRVHLKDMHKETLAQKLEIVENQHQDNGDIYMDFQLHKIITDTFIQTDNYFSNSLFSSGGHARDCYVMDPDNMGICLIVNEKNFNKETCDSQYDLRRSPTLDTRNGTDIDRDCLNIVFTSFGYKVLIFEDLKSNDFEKKIKQVIKNDIKRKHSSFVLCILSHGVKGAVYCSDNIPIKVEKIESWILGEECPKLLGKPKVLIIQACQGKDKQIARIYEDSDGILVTDGVSDSSVVPPTADLLTFWATVSGYASIRNPQKGTWFIQSIYKQLIKQGHTSHLKDIFTSVNLEISEMRSPDYAVMMSKSEDTIRKKIYFPYIPEIRWRTSKSILEKYLFHYLLYRYEAMYKMYMEFQIKKRLSLTSKEAVHL